MRRIGEKWGPVLSIDNSVDGLCSLTHARILVRTKAQNKIDARIRLIFEHESCDVWVNVRSCFCGLSGLCAKNNCELGKVNSRLRVDELNLAAESDDERDLTVCIPPVDPLISDLYHRTGASDSFKWHNPIVVNETAGLLTLKSNDNLEAYPQLGEGHEQPCLDTTTLGNQSKNPRGRPKKKLNQKLCESPITPLPRSCVEALDTWNTAKLIGISSTEESVVISGLRKSKRLMIMDGILG